MDVDLPPNEDVAQQDASNILYDLPYDSWVWGPHSGGWLAGWCLNMEHNCGLFMVMLFYMYAMGSKPYVETCNWAEIFAILIRKQLFIYFSY